MAELNLLKIEGKPLEKLIEVVSNGIGTIYKPRAIRKEAEAEAYRIEIIERAKSKALAEGKEIEAETFERIQERILHKELNRQNNIDNVTQIAAAQLREEREVSSEPVDKDWTNRFFGIVEDISDEEMQRMWGRILAGEVKQPKSFSLRALEILKNISKSEAEVFTRFAEARIYSGKDFFVFNDRELLEHEFGITFSDILLLTELGLLISENQLTYTYKATNSSKNLEALYFGEKVILFHRNEGAPEQRLPILFFTKIGSELSKLISQKSNIKYIEEICKTLSNAHVSIEYGDAIIFPDGGIKLFNTVNYKKPSS